MANSALSSEQLSTLFYQVEVDFNARPIGTVSDKPNAELNFNSAHSNTGRRLDSRSTKDTKELTKFQRSSIAKMWAHRESGNSFLEHMENRNYIANPRDQNEIMKGKIFQLVTSYTPPTTTVLLSSG